jgi:hypothetical protein
MSLFKKAVIDRFEGNLAVLLMDEKPKNVLRTLLPKGVKEGDWLEVEFEGERLVSAKVDAEEKERMKQRIEDKLARLRGRKK